MKKLYEKNEVLFAVLCILIYVIGSSAVDSASEAIAMPKCLTVILLGIFSAVLILFPRQTADN